MLVRYHYVIIQSITVLAAVVLALASSRPRATSTSASPPIPKATTTPIGAEARVVAQEERASFVTEVSFVPKSFALTADTKQKLSRALLKASTSGRIEKIHLIVWADREYPSSKRQNLPLDQVRLADRRAKAINDYLKERSPGSITDAFNMAERPGALQSILATADARIKRTLESAGIRTTADDLDAREYATKALVLVLVNN